MKYAFIQEQQVHFDVQLMCQMLGVSRSGYYTFCSRQPSRRHQATRTLDMQIKQIYSAHRGRYGMPRIHRELQAQGRLCGRHRIAPDDCEYWV